MKDEPEYTDVEKTYCCQGMVELFPKLELDPLKLHEEYGYGDGNAAVLSLHDQRINYCPFCGRKITLVELDRIQLKKKLIEVWEDE